MTKQISFGAFISNSVNDKIMGLWRHPHDNSLSYTSIKHWMDLARLLERGHFDYVFFADFLGLHDVWGGSAATTLRHGGLACPMNDPLQAVVAMAAASEHIGLTFTGSTVVEHPYPFARRMSTLDHLSCGRAGWNIVTSFSETAARNMGQELLPHDCRYDIADEYLEVCYKLWEGSWAPEARAPRGSKEYFADPRLIHNINHEGTYFTVPGIHLSEPSPQRTPMLWQAGSSKRGSEFAARHAEGVITVAPSAAQLRTYVDRVRGLAEAFGRARDDIKIQNMAVVVVAETDLAARDLYTGYQRYQDPIGALAYMSGLINVDLSKFPLDEPIGNFKDRAETNAIQGFLLAMRAEDSSMTLRELGEYWAWSSTCPTMVGSPQTVADQMQAWCEESDTDGFFIPNVVRPETYEQVAEFLVPELQRRGAYKTDYVQGTLREKIFAAGPYLPARHIAERFRHLNSPVQA